MKREQRKDRTLLFIPGILLLAVVGVVALFREASLLEQEAPPTFSRTLMAKGEAEKVERIEATPTAVSVPSPHPSSSSSVLFDAEDLAPDEYRIRVVDENGVPVRLARIDVLRRHVAVIANARNDADIMSTALLQRVVTNERGETGFRGDDSGRLDAIVDVDGYAKTRFRLRDPGARVLRLVRPAVIAGHVYDASARPVPGVQVELTHDTLGDVETRVTDEFGFYEFDRVTPEIATILVHSPHHIRSDIEHVRVESGLRTIRDFDLRRGSTLRVAVRDSGGGAAVGAQVVVQEALSGVVVAGLKSDGAGVAEFSCLKPDRPYLVKAASDLGGLAYLHVPPSTSSEFSVELTLTPSWEMTGRVETMDGVAIPDAIVVVQSEPMAFLSTTAHVARSKSGGDGRFSIGDLYSNLRYEVAVYHPMFGITPLGTTDRVAVAPDGFTARLADPGVIRGVARTPSGEPIAGAWVWVELVNELADSPDSPSALGYRMHVEADEDGRYVIPNLPMDRSVSITILDARGSTSNPGSTKVDPTPQAFEEMPYLVPNDVFEAPPTPIGSGSNDPPMIESGIVGTSRTAARH